MSDLNFGTVLAGVMKRVLAHGTDAGVFEIQGPPVASIRVEFILPVALVASGGSIPLSFGPGDGFAGATLGSHGGSTFDPHSPLICSLSGSGRLFVRMGGTASPGGAAGRGGVYHATIAMTVYDLGS